MAGSRLRRRDDGGRRLPPAQRRRLFSQGELDPRHLRRHAHVRTPWLPSAKQADLAYPGFSSIITQLVCVCACVIGLREDVAPNENKSDVC